MELLKKWKAGITQRLPGIVLVLLIIQPCMDVLSYALTEWGDTTISTLLRFGMMMVIGLLGFIVTDRKRKYILFYCVLAVFWILHVANGFRVGYISVYEDTANYLRILTTPVFLLSFITFFHKSGERIRKLMPIGFAINMGLSCLFTILPWGLAAVGIGEPIYTYDGLYVGVLGWFAIANAQSCILALLAPLTLYFCYKTGKVWVFLVGCLVSFGQMYAMGTKLTYYSLVLIPVAFLVLFLLNDNRKKNLVYMVIFFSVIVLAVVLKPYSPMQIRDNMTNYSQGYLSDRVEQSISGSGVDEEVMEAIREGTVEEGETEEEQADAAQQLADVRRSLMGVYTDPDVYGDVLLDMNDRFGVYNVMDGYHYTANSALLSDLRLRRTNYAELVWAESDWPTKLFGFEYSQMIHNNTIYDLENDFPAIYYNCGIIGYILYLGMFVYLALLALRAFYRDPFHFMTLELGTVGMTIVLALGAAGISGYVFRRPNVAIYLAAACAYLYYLTVEHCPPKPEKNPWIEMAVAIKGKLPFIKKSK